MARREVRMMKASTVMVMTVAAKRVPASEAAMAGYSGDAVGRDSSAGSWLEWPEGSKAG